MAKSCGYLIRRNCGALPNSRFRPSPRCSIITITSLRDPGVSHPYVAGSLMDTHKIFDGVTLHGMPVHAELQWPFHSSGGGSDWYVLHGTLRLADGGVAATMMLARVEFEAANFAEASLRDCGNFVAIVCTNCHKLPQNRAFHVLLTCSPARPRTRSKRLFFNHLS